MKAKAFWGGVMMSVIVGWSGSALGITHELRGVQTLNLWFPLSVIECQRNALVIERHEELLLPPRGTIMYPQHIPSKVTPGKILCELGSLELSSTIKPYRFSSETISLNEKFLLLVQYDLETHVLKGQLQFTPPDHVQKDSRENQLVHYRGALALLLARFSEFREPGILFQMLVYEP